MNILVTCVILSSFIDTFAAPLNANLLSTKESGIVQALQQTLASIESNNIANNKNREDDDLATLQTLLNVLAQADKEKARAVAGERAESQLINTLWDIAKNLFRTAACNEKHERKVTLQELLGEQGMSQDEEKRDRVAEASAQLQTSISALKYTDVKTMQDDKTVDSQAEAQFWNIIKDVGKKVLC